MRKLHRDGVITDATIEAAAGSLQHQRELYVALDRKDKARRAQIATLQSGGHVVPASTAEECRNLALYEELSRAHPDWQAEVQTLAARGGGKGGVRVAETIKETCSMATQFMKDSNAQQILQRNVDAAADKQVMDFLMIATVAITQSQQQQQARGSVSSSTPTSPFSPPAAPRKRLSKSERVREVKQCLADDTISQEQCDKAIETILAGD